LLQSRSLRPQKQDLVLLLDVPRVVRTHARIPVPEGRGHLVVIGAGHPLNIGCERRPKTMLG
jgi:hypothetical protein